ncbi:MAG: sugar transferase, partial [Candidatus Eremiobacteraeota bacterium]|nr:sugar transferase [Candidatus Eremiobacteraeota bacterium]
MAAVVYSDVLAAARPNEIFSPIRAIPRPWQAFLLAGDVTMFLIASLAAPAVLQRRCFGFLDIQHIGVPTIVYAILWVAIFYRLGLYHRSLAKTVKDEFYFVTAALSMGVMLQLLVFTLVPSVATSRAVLLMTLLLSIFVVGAFRAIAHLGHDAVTRAGRCIVVVGEASTLDAVVQSLCQSGNLSVYWLAVSDIAQATRAQAPSEIAKQGWFRHALLWKADQILFTAMPSPDSMPMLLEAAAQAGITIGIAPPQMRAHAYNVTVETAGGQVLIMPRPLRACRPGARLFKRVFDIAAAAALTVVFGPIMLAIAALLALDGSGPILYKQERVGRNGQIFEILKFRTMRVDAEREGARFATKGDPRVTKLGRVLRRTSLDELPQLFNVLRGDMSLVGPRPLVPEYVPRYTPEQARRHDVLPGITGLAQVSGRNAISWERRLELDAWYVDHRSLALDL